MFEYISSSHCAPLLCMFPSNNIFRHKLTEHEGVRYACDQCGAEFTAQGNLRRHKLSKHEQVRRVGSRISCSPNSRPGSMGVRLVQVHVHRPGQLEAAQADEARGRHLRLLPVSRAVWQPWHPAQTYSHRARGSQVNRNVKKLWRNYRVALS